MYMAVKIKREPFSETALQRAYCNMYAINTFRINMSSDLFPVKEPYGSTLISDQ